VALPPVEGREAEPPGGHYWAEPSNEEMGELTAELAGQLRGGRFWIGRFGYS